MEKKSISVREMQNMLGVCKTDAYWLLNKNYFDVIVISKKKRILLDSFNDWYDHQFHYRKKNGPPPGTKGERTMSVREFGERIGITEGAAYWRVHHDGLEVQSVNGRMRITEETFRNWLNNQNRYSDLFEGKTIIND